MEPNVMKKLLILCAILSGSASLLQAEKLVPFQGYLTGADGNSLPDGARLVQFKLYDAPIGGTAVWPGEVHRLSVNGGLVNTVLGTKNGFDGGGDADAGSVDFGQTLYLEITVDSNGNEVIGPEDPPLLPRQILSPAVFAQEAAEANRLNGYDWSVVFADGDPDPRKGRFDGGRLVADSVRGGAIVNGEISPAKLVPMSIGLGNLTPELQNLILDRIPVQVGQVLGVAMVQRADVITSSDTAIPFSNSVPVNTQGKSILTLDYKPTAVGNELIIEAVAWLSELSNHSNAMVAAVFVNDNPNAEAVGLTMELETGEAHHAGAAQLMKKIQVTNLEPHHFELRAGPNGGGAWVLNQLPASSPNVQASRGNLDRYTYGDPQDASEGLNSYLKVTEIRGPSAD